MVPQRNQHYRTAGEPDAYLYCCAPVDGESVSEHSLLQLVSEATLEAHTPRTAYEAMRSPQRQMWIEAMNREIACHEKNATFGGLKSVAKAIPADWVFKIKYRGGDVDIDRLESKCFKARVVIRGQYMREGVHYTDTFAPVAKQTTIRALLAFASKHACHLSGGDVETAFLTAKMDREVVVKMPPYWGERGISPEQKVAGTRLLLKGIPGIPQGSRLFYQTIKAHLLSMGFKPTASDCCLFLNEEIKEYHALAIWVDDFIFAYQAKETFATLLRGLKRKFNITVSDSLSCFLGMTVKRSSSRLWTSVNQSNTIKVLLERAGMADCNSVLTPCTQGVVFKKAGEEEAPVDLEAYRSLVALANYISCWTRPDITFVVNKLCKFMSHPTSEHWRVLKQLLRYLKGTCEVNLVFDFTGMEGTGNLVGYSDSSFGDCPDTGRSTLAYILLWGRAPLAWYSKTNTYVTTCTNHSEYAALALATKEAEWLLSLLTELERAPQPKPLPIMVDNAGIIAMR